MRVLVVFVVIGVAVFFWLRADDAPGNTEAAPRAGAKAAQPGEAATQSGFGLVNTNWDVNDEAPVYIPPRERVLLDDKARERAEAAGEEFGTGSMLEPEVDRAATGGSAIVNIREDQGDKTVLELE